MKESDVLTSSAMMSVGGFNPRSSWKTKILFAIEKLPDASPGKVAEYLHCLEPDKAIDEILSYVTWYTVQIQSEM